MTTGTKRLVALFVERSSQQWVVWDPEDTFWLRSSIEGSVLKVEMAMSTPRVQRQSG